MNLNPELSKTIVRRMGLNPDQLRAELGTSKQSIRLFAKASYVPLLLIALTSCHTVQASIAQGDAPVIFDPSSDFTGVSNPSSSHTFPNIWTFGYYTAAADPVPSTFHPYLYKDTQAGTFQWHMYNGLDHPKVSFNPTLTAIRVDKTTWGAKTLALHPGPHGEYSVVRWKAPVSGVFLVAANFIGIDSTPTSTVAYIYENDNRLLSTSINSENLGHPFSSYISTEKGDTLDFVIGYGTNKSDIHDATALQLTITLVDSTEQGAISNLIDGILPIPVPPSAKDPFQDVLVKESHEVVNDQNITTQNRTATNVMASLAAFNPNAGALFPGAIVTGNSLKYGILNRIQLPRTGGTLTLTDLTFTKSLPSASPTGSLVGKINIEPLNARVGEGVPAKIGVDGSPSYSKTITSTIPSTVHAAIQQILAQNVHGSPPARIFFDERRFYSLDQAMLQIGASVSWLSGSIAARLSSDYIDKKSNYLFEYIQPYYTVSFDPGSPASYFASNVTLPQLRSVAFEGNPPAYISSVTYGRMMLLLVSSDDQASDVKAALDVAFKSGFTSVSASLSAEEQKILKSSEIKALILGGPGTVAAPLLQGNGIDQYVQAGAAFSAASQAVPISYECRYVRDNDIAKLSFTTDYTVKNYADIGVNIASLAVVFHTINQKDGDTTVNCKVFRNGNELIAQTGDFANSDNGADQWKDGYTTPAFGLPLLQTIPLADVAKLKVIVYKTSKGNNDWNFYFDVIGTATNGKTYYFVAGDPHALTKLDINPTDSTTVNFVAPQ